MKEREAASPTTDHIWKADNPTIPTRERIRALKARAARSANQAQKHACLAQQHADRADRDLATIRILEGRPYAS